MTMTIRPPTVDDWPRIGELAELLVQTHYAFDHSRFIHPDALRGGDYTARVRDEIGQGHAMVHVAENHSRVVGYVFAGVEPASWKELRHDAGYIHDVMVDDQHRHLGIGRALVASAIHWFAARGVTRVMLWTAPANTDAQRLFRSIGFRPTMIEMTLQPNLGDDPSIPR
jgi:ribosomal protein S18 acetylase RimI-like enzyme